MLQGKRICHQIWYLQGVVEEIAEPGPALEVAFRRLGTEQLQSGSWLAGEESTNP